MGKKIILVFSICALIITIIVGIQIDAKNSKTVQVANEKIIEKIRKNAIETELSLSLSFDGEELPFDHATKTFYLPLNMESDEWETGKFEGVFLNQDGKEKQKVDLFFERDYTNYSKKLAISENLAFPFMAASKKEYGEYNVVFTGLPIVTFQGTEDLADDGTIMFRMKVYGTNHSDEWVTKCYTKAGLRGNTSLTYDKKSLRLYLKKKNDDGSYEKVNKNLLGLRDDDDWILNSLYADNTRIRDQLCVELWNEVGAKDRKYGYSYSTDSEMVEVFINDGYQGMYDLMVPIDAKRLGFESVSSQLSRNKTVVNRIYKKKYSRDWFSEDFTGELPDANSPDYRGGFYLQGDSVLVNEEEWNPLFRLAKTLEAEPDEFAQEIVEYNNQQNIIDNWLFYQAIAGFDNQNKNYFYVVQEKAGREYGYFIPWDMNLSFGMVYADNEFYSENSVEVVNEPTVWQPGQRMIELDVADSKQMLKETWAAWRNGPFSNVEIIERIRKLEHKAKDSGAFDRECIRYPEGNQDEDFTYIYDFTRDRLLFVDYYIEEMTR